MKMQNSAVFLKKTLNIYMPNIRNVIKLEIIVIVQENMEVLHIA